MRSEATQQASQYDKIIKENLDVTLPVIIRDVLALDVCDSEELPDDIQHTKERKPDALKKITDSQGKSYVLHLEFQRSDDSEMVYRMADYYIMLLRKYKLTVKQFVIFLSEKNPKMPTNIVNEHLTFDFELIRLNDIDYKLFLRSENPEIKMLGILANYRSDSRYKVVKTIVDGIDKSLAQNLNKSRYFKQLRIFARLRTGVEQELLKVMDSLGSFFKIENDAFYKYGEKKGETKGEKRGEKKGEKKKTDIVVANLLSELKITDEQAARIADVPVSYIRKMRRALKKKQA